ncbi:hypothetical protein [Streptomyces sp. ME18-1-4]|uniref:hypothetical protein n=1 Tax=Streptomyces sp. ME18-1-4 TaxID=3028685 RepID=UPI0029BD67E0|nr:hypothetical protein [Streptomyces sp. ME18-1-4]MDX3247531.1 hypothetical protein [Streptomyces sp. ME18-1-4]
MGALRRIWLLPVVVVVAGAAVACEPGGLSAMSVAYTTDQAATAEIERRDVKVRWLTCTAQYEDRAKAESVASVDCKGQTGDGKDITVTGKITRAVDGACVRGDLTAVVGKKQLFRVSGLGDCRSATPSPVKPSGSAQPGGRPTVTVTVTVTETVDGGGGGGGAGK